MPAYYTVVQCVPDPIADERINVGVIVFGEGSLYSRFVQNWDRVSRFAQEDIEYVREFAQRVEQAAIEAETGVLQPIIPGVPGPRRLDEATLMTITGEWNTSIQLTPAQPSLERPDALLIRLVETFLKEPQARPAQFRDRQAAARIAVKVVREAVAQKVGPTTAAELVRAGYSVGGKVVPRIRLDMAVKNAQVYVASRALSFETHNIPELDQQMRDAIYSLRDVGELLKSVQLDLVALRPRRELQGYHRAKQRFDETIQSCRQIGVRLILEEDAPEWAEEIAIKVETRIASHRQKVEAG